MPVISTSSHLHCANHPGWLHEPDYNPEITEHLTQAYATIHQVPDRVASYREAGYHVITQLDLPMCPQQRMNVCYILAMAHAADDEFREALPWLDQAVVLARALQDLAAETDLLYLRGLIALRLTRFKEALEDYRIALRLHRARHQAEMVVDSEQELHLLIAAAAFALSQEEYDLVSCLLSSARRVARRVVAAPSIAAYHDYIWAAYLEACGHPERALQPALRAVATVDRDHGDAYYDVRMHTFAALLATDLAASHQEQSVGRTTHLAMAIRCLREARKRLDPRDRDAKGVLAIRKARIDALRHREARALERVAAVEQLARELSSNWLLASALTVHGQILEQQPQDWEEACRLYREAQVAATACGMPYAGLSARRALRRLEEQMPHDKP